MFAGSEIYGGLANSWDYGPYGTELMNNIRNHWWDFFVRRRSDMVGLESTVIMNPKVWEASGHLAEFHDLLVEDKVSHERFRVDHLLEEKGIKAEGMTADQMREMIQKKKIKSPVGNELTRPRQFNLMFKTYIGPAEDNSALAYLRPETAQGMFADFHEVLQTTRKRLPFGIAQIGKCFRNEITPGQFIFRLREFNLMEFEYFIHPKSWEKLFEMWLSEIKKYHEELGLKQEDIVWHEIPDGERAHYSKRTIDIEFKFPFGTKELHAIAYRTDYDLKAHEKVSRKDLSYTDPEKGEKFVPHVIEPTFGADRTLFAVLCSAYHEEEAPTATGEKETRIVLKIPSRLAPVKVAIFPLLKNKPELVKMAKKIYNDLKTKLMCEFDDNGNIGKRYRRQDEIGTPFCVTVDFDSLNDNAVTVRDRDTMKQERIKISELIKYLNDKLNL